MNEQNSPLAILSFYSASMRTYYVATKADPKRFASVYEFAPGHGYNVVAQVPERVPADIAPAALPGRAAEAVRRYYIQEIIISPFPDVRLWAVLTKTGDDPESEAVESLRLDAVQARKGELWRLVEMMEDGDSLTFVSAQSLTSFRIQCEDFRETL